MSSWPWARFVVRPDTNGALIGKDFGAFTPGYVYEARLIMDEVVIYRRGRSPLLIEGGVGELRRFGVAICNGNETQHIMSDGDHLLTLEELARRVEEQTGINPLTPGERLALLNGD
jgi:hypothetical protein